MPRLSYEVDPSLPPFDDFPITVTLKDGRVFSKVETMLLGNVVNPMTWEQIEHKFWNCTRYSAIDLGEKKYRRIIEMCQSLEQVEDMRELLEQLVP